MAVEEIDKNIDLLLIIGTELILEPFSNILDKVPFDVPKVLINQRSPTEEDGGIDFKEPHNYKLFIQGNCD